MLSLKPQVCEVEITNPDINGCSGFTQNRQTAFQADYIWNSPQKSFVPDTVAFTRISSATIQERLSNAPISSLPSFTKTIMSRSAFREIAIVVWHLQQCSVRGEEEGI